MMKLNNKTKEYENRLRSLYADLHQLAGDVSVTRFEHIVRQIHLLSFKIKSFKGGLNNGNK